MRVGGRRNNNRRRKRFPTRRQKRQAGGLCHPKHGGDFFNVYALSDTEAAVFICDVTGHGVRAALVTAMIRALAEELKPLAREPGNFFAQTQFRFVQHP